MIILFACLGSFAAGVAVGLFIAYCYWCKIKRAFNEALEKELHKYNLTLDK